MSLRQAFLGFSLIAGLSACDKAQGSPTKEAIVREAYALEVSAINNDPHLSPTEKLAKLREAEARFKRDLLEANEEALRKQRAEEVLQVLENKPRKPYKF